MLALLVESSDLLLEPPKLTHSDGCQSVLSLPTEPSMVSQLQINKEGHNETHRIIIFFSFD